MSEQALPVRIAYPQELPVSHRRDDIVEALRAHQVVVLAGDTGSGKTTQLPKMCLEAGRRRIAHTQPRRIAARAVAERLAEELDVPLGGFVGYRVRFTDETAADTAITVMTDGLLLASIRKDRLLRQYDTIVIDEAHERSLNIDFLLGYLAWLLPQRPDLLVVITSATLDTAKFSAHFDDAPVIEVSGRTFPVEIRYRPSRDDEDEVQAMTAAAGALLAEGSGDILVFLSGEREIRDATDAVTAAYPHVDVVPLYGRLSAAEQHRVFAAHERRRIVLSTNVAETSLTVPGIHYVIDAGTARISRYSTRLKIQRLPIEPISRASASQRSGRCGRVADGICIRLYGEDDFLARPEFTDPEILRTNLASVLLQMATLGLGEIETFPFIDPPDRRAIAAGIALLEEIGALSGEGGDVTSRVTSLGRRIARLPLDPRLARMVIAAEDFGVVDDVVVIAAGLTIRDPRERPDDQAGLADASHARFRDPTSDLLTLLNLWDHLQGQQSALSSTKFRAMCRKEFLHYLRVREWQDLVTQVQNALSRRRPARTASPSRDSDAIHRAVLSGLLSHIGALEPEVKPAPGKRERRPRRDYRGARGTRFALWPGSALAAKGATSPAWIMAAEVVETTRLWGRMAAVIDPAWAEELAGPLLRRHHGDPVWSRKRGCAVCTEQVTLYGVPLVTDRRINYYRVDPVSARELFIRHALVEGDWEHRHRVLKDNERLIEEARDREERARRRDAVIDDDDLYAFYDARIPENIVSARHFDAWWRRERETAPDLLRLTATDIADLERMPAEAEFPSAWPPMPGIDAELAVTYRFDPADERDGVTVHVPVALLPRLPGDAFDWQVPGMREELVAALVRGLPKDLRREVGPAPNATAAILRGLRGRDLVAAPLDATLSAVVRAELGVVVPPGAWQLAAVPSHVRVTVAIIGDNGQEIAAGKDLTALTQSLKAEAAATVASLQPGLHRRRITDWPDDVHWVTTTEGETHSVTAYPTIVAQPDGSVAIEVLASAAEQAESMPAGIARLLCLAVPLRPASLKLSTHEKLVLARNPQGSVHALLTECAEAVARHRVDARSEPWDRDGFTALCEDLRGRQVPDVETLLAELSPLLEAWWSATTQLDDITSPALAPSVADVRAQIANLVHPGFLLQGRPRAATRLDDITRYLRAAERRVSTMSADAVRDLQRREQVEQVTGAFDALPLTARESAEGQRIRWLIEEFRVSLWAQDLRTREPVSQKRLLQAIASLA